MTNEKVIGQIFLRHGYSKGKKVKKTHHYAHCWYICILLLVHNEGIVKHGAKKKRLAGVNCHKRKQAFEFSTPVKSRNQCLLLQG